MSNLLVDSSDIANSVVALLRQHLGLPVGDGTAPKKGNTSEREDLPYVIVHSLDVTNFSGPCFVSPEADSEEQMQVATFGLRADQVRLVRDKVLNILMGRDDNGRYLYDINLENHKVMQRSLGLKSRIRSEGTVFLAEDLFRFNVTSQV